MTGQIALDTAWDNLTPATQARTILRADAERSDKLGVVIGGSLSTARALKAIT
jgi:hypothetical protein